MTFHMMRRGEVAKLMCATYYIRLVLPVFVYDAMLFIKHAYYERDGFGESTARACFLCTIEIIYRNTYAYIYE